MSGGDPASEYNAAAIERGLDAPFAVEYHDSIGSTNDRARELAAAGEASIVVLADEQTGGRGRLDREWSSPSGGIWCSIVVRPERPPESVPILTLAAAVATTRAAREAGIDAGIKWPNDVLVPDGSDADRSSGDDRKLAGILTETAHSEEGERFVIVGIGLNADLDPDQLPEGSTSMRAQVGAVDRRLVVQRLLERFDELRCSSDDEVLDAWREDALTLGRQVRVETGDDPIVGKAVDVTAPGSLVIDTIHGRERVHAGDCEHLRPVEE